MPKYNRADVTISGNYKDIQELVTLRWFVIGVRDGWSVPGAPINQRLHLSGVGGLTGSFDALSDYPVIEPTVL
jgi:hypothetical protein